MQRVAYTWLMLVMCSGWAWAATPPYKPYDETVDAHQSVAQTLEAARAAGVPTLIVFGANWCPDCLALDAALRTGRNAELMAREFRVVKVDVGQFDKHLDIARAYGNPIEKGIPAVVIVGQNQQVLYTTRAGQLANARKMTDGDIYDFFKAAVQQSRP